MDDIAEAAGVTKPLLYQHFSSKRSLYLELVDSIAKDLLIAISTAAAGADGPRQQPANSCAVKRNAASIGVPSGMTDWRLGRFAHELAK